MLFIIFDYKNNTFANKPFTLTNIGRGWNMEVNDVLFCPRLEPACDLDPLLLVIAASAALKAD